MTQWIRWLAVIPAAIAGWWLAALIGIGLHGAVSTLCSPEEIVSGACMAPWFLTFEWVLLHASVALAAILVVVLPAILAPVRRSLVAWAAYVAGAIAAVYMSAHRESLSLLIATLAAGLVAVLVVRWLYAPKVA